MTIKQLRDYPGPAELAELYATPHRHGKWADHRARVRATVALASEYVDLQTQVADLSCGDGVIATTLQHAGFSGPNLPEPILGDLAPGYQYTGPIEETIHQIPRVDFFVCCETLEHVKDPQLVLEKIRTKSSRLLLSTPEGEWTSHNREHVWGWDLDGIAKLLFLSGWKPEVRAVIDFRPRGDEYAYQVWICK